jgi:TPP-dependent trihydroxycyclohexane-1,2-dione (THcHDO) dehydratase
LNEIEHFSKVSLTVRFSDYLTSFRIIYHNPDGTVFAIKFKEHGAYKTERKRIFRSPKDMEQG